ncbi:GGDEF domain-containing protein [Ectothiorhodospiraceae bacterium BW-2]|nr:GGDEF domain-containing protein [Ectothiorhodospiraceae bacterium BW-2]
MSLSSVAELKQRARSAVRDLLGEGGSDMWGLLLPWRQPELIKPQRAYLIISRVRLIALMFAVLTPLWIMVDLQLLPRSVGLQLAAARIITSLAFAGLFLTFRRSDRLLHAYIGTILLFLIPTLFYFYAHTILLNLETTQTGLAMTLIAGYTYLPFVLVAGLAIFPLSALEGMIFVLPAMAIMAYTGLSNAAANEWDTQLGMLWLMAMIAGVAIISGMSQLHYLIEIILKSAHDPLTKAFNRASGSELLEKYFHLAQRNQSPLTLMFFDLDHFKSINDRYGHDAGDLVLVQFVTNLNQWFRKEDIIIRWGGEEFLVALPHIDGVARHNRLAFIERLFQTSLGRRPDGSPVTASIGVASLHSDNANSWSDLIELADQRMYLAKQAGRDRLCFGEGEWLIRTELREVDGDDDAPPQARSLLAAASESAVADSESP